MKPASAMWTFRIPIYREPVPEAMICRLVVQIGSCRASPTTTPRFTAPPVPVAITIPKSPTTVTIGGTSMDQTVRLPSVSSIRRMRPSGDTKTRLDSVRTLTTSCQTPSARPSPQKAVVRPPQATTRKPSSSTPSISCVHTER